jgi:PAS domain S-box-containing protein
MCSVAILVPQEQTLYVDARMTPVVPDKPTWAKPSRLIQELSDLVLSGLEFLGAQAGWIGLQETGGLTFPVRVGAFSDTWLPLHRTQGSVWGFTINDETEVLNDLGIASKRGNPPLCNLLSCPLIHDEHLLGHVALANKAHGFTPQDAFALQGLAYHVVRLLSRRRSPEHSSIVLPAAWRVLLDRSAEGILLLDKSGVLIHANATWLRWTGFREEELLGRTAPFPFWVSQHDLAQALSAAPAADAGALPFLRRDQSLFWCVVKTTEQLWDDHLITLSFLRQTASPSPAAAAPTFSSHEADKVGACDGMATENSFLVRWPSLDCQPLLLDLDHGIEGWEARWEERTGLSMRDVEGSRCELVLDWLFPQQHDRNRVADCLYHPRSTGYQLVLQVASPAGSRPMACTFLPLPAQTTTTGPRRWLLLVGEMERVAQRDALDGTNDREPTVRIVSPRT